MSINDDAHRDIFLTRFGTSVVYTPAVNGAYGSTGISIKAIIDEPGQTKTVNGVLVRIMKRQATVKTSDVSTPSTKDTITIGTKVYDIISPEPDGTGFTVLTLTASGKP